VGNVTRYRGSGRRRSLDVDDGDDRFSFADLEAALGTARACDTAARIGASRETVYRWRRRPLDAYAADHYACRAGLHPAEIWPEWLTSASVEA
jgi:hypothetical protein